MPKITRADKEFIEQCLDAYSAKSDMTFPAKETPNDPEDEGVPEVMMNGSIDSEGYVLWKMIPSTVKERDVTGIEKDLPGPFPPLFRAYLTARHTLGMDDFDLPSLPSDNPLRELAAVIKGWSVLLPSGYVPFADNAGGDTGPICFDLRQRLPDGDCPVVLFDHDKLNNLSEAELGERRKLERLAKRRYGSFREMMQRKFLRSKK